MRLIKLCFQSTLALSLVLVSGLSVADYVSDVQALVPIAYWRLNETSSTTADNIGSLGAAADGTYTDAVSLDQAGPPLLGLSNSSIAVGPASGFVGTNSSLLSNMSAFTIMAFVRPGARNSDRIGLVGQDNAIELGFIGPNTIEIWTSPTELDVSYSFPNDEWHHVAAVGDGTALRIYFDGILQGTHNSVEANYGSSAADVNIAGGGIFDASGNQYTGSIDEVAVLDYALSGEQINALIPPPPPSVEPATPVPAMGVWGLLLMTLGLGFWGLIALRRTN